MTSAPDLPPQGGEPSRRKPWPPGVRRVRRINPVRYVAGLLLWQGVAWLALAAVGLGSWIVALRAGLGPGSARPTVLWTSAQLLAIAIGAGIGAAEVGMACRLRGGPRWVQAMAIGLPGMTLGAGPVVAAVAIMIGGSVLELLALNGAF